MIENLIQRLTHQPGSLDNLLENLSEKNIIGRPIPEKWSIFENIAHLGRYHEVYIERMKLILTEESPVFPRYVADNDAGFAEWCRKSLPGLLEAFANSRKQLNNMVISFPDDKLQRAGTHPVFGKMTIEGWTEFFLLHEAHHFFTIFKLAATLKPNS